MSLLDEAGVLDASRPAASPELLEARATVVKLLDRWDPETVKANFDPQTQRYSFVRNFRQDFERLTEQHGRCAPEGDIVSDGPRHGRFRLRCERGAVELGAYLTPGSPPVIQMVDWRQELPVTEQERRVATKLVTSLNQAVERPRGLFAEKDAAEFSRRLARERVTYGTCSVSRPLYDDGKGNSLFELQCGASAAPAFVSRRPRVLAGGGARRDCASRLRCRVLRVGTLGVMLAEPARTLRPADLRRPLAAKYR